MAWVVADAAAHAGEVGAAHRNAPSPPQRVAMVAAWPGRTPENPEKYFRFIYMCEKDWHNYLHRITGRGTALPFRGTSGHAGWPCGTASLLQPGERHRGGTWAENVPRWSHTPVIWWRYICVNLYLYKRKILKKKYISKFFYF